MKECINKCYTKYGTRPLSLLEIKFKKQLKNGLWCVIGKISTKEDGISIDVYEDKELKNIVFMEHGITTINMKPFNQWNKNDFEWISILAENRCQEMNI